jgi:hypothetical protein
VNVSTKPIVVYISHSYKDDIEQIRDYLGGEGCIVRDSYDLSAPEDIGDAIRFGISQADFVVAAIGAQTPNVFFELGFAVGLGKPTLLLLEPGGVAPAFLADSPYLFSDLRNSDVLRLALKKFLGSEANKRVSHDSGSDVATSIDRDTMRSLLTQIREARSLRDPHRVHRLVVELFRAVHVSAVEEARAVADLGVDFVIWSQSLQTSIGNPVFVEVKSGKLSGVTFRRAYNHLLTLALRLGSGMALLLYLDFEGRRFDEREHRSSSVLAFDLEDFALELASKTFEKVVVERRNRLVHGLA